MKIHYNKIGWLLFVITFMFGLISWLFFYKTPISLDDEGDVAKIMYFLQEEHGDANVKDVRLGGKFPITGLFKDLIEMKYPQTPIEHAKSVSYVVETDTTLYHYVTLFEIKQGLTSEEIGRKLITGRNYFFGMAK